MGNWKHTLTLINTEKRAAVCSKCGPVKVRNKPSNKLWRCSKAINEIEARYKKKKKQVYRKHLKKECERCGFKPEHRCQLDIHHLDGDHSNNVQGNLQTLCANCHRYVEEILRSSNKGYFLKRR